MKRLMTSMLLMAFLSVSCNKSGSSSSDGSNQNSNTEAASAGDSAAVPNTTPPAATSTLPALALSFKTNVDLLNFTTTEEEKYNKAVVMVKKVVGTEKFKNSVINHTWGGVKTYANNRGMTNSQIYQSVLDAAESLKPIKNNTMDLGVKLYYEASTVIGYTNTSINYINVNTKYFNTFSINDVAGNLFHEWLHKLGYGHDSAATAQRPYSVPYAVGYIVRDIGKSFL